MKISFLGAAGEVTGSKYLVEHENTKVLVDCGLFQEHEKFSIRNQQPFPTDPRKIDAIILTHAHIDHTGYIPALVKNGFTGKIYCSQGTYELCSLLLPDSGAIQQEEYEKNKELGKPAALPLYNKVDAQKSLEFFHTVDFDKLFTIGKNLKVTLIQSGHIIGSSFVVVSDGQQTLTFSGDLGRPDQYLMKSPTLLKQTDYLIIESTYGDRLHQKVDQIEALAKVIHQTIAKKGVLIIPAFAVGRAQTILYCLYELKKRNAIPKIPIFLDSPMAIHASNLMCNFPDEIKLSPLLCNDIMDVAQFTEKVEHSKAIDTIKPPMIIISASGMAEGGRVLHHFKRFIFNERNTVLFVGFQAEETKGYALVHGEKRIEIDGKWYNVHADIQIIDSFSAHADYNEILEWLGYFENKPKKVFITHGQLEAAQSLKKKIEERFGWSVVVPKYLESFDLD